MKSLHNVKVAVKMAILSVLIDIIGLYGIFGKNKIILIVLFLLTFVYCLALMVDIVDTIKKASAYGEILASGDFTTIPTKRFITREDELGDLARSMKDISDNMSELVGTIQEEVKTLDEVVSSTNESVAIVTEEVSNVSSTTQELAAGNEETAASTEEVNSMADEIETAAKNIATRAQEGATRVEQIHERAKSTKNQVIDKRGNTKRIHTDIKGSLTVALENAKIVDEIEVLAESIKGITSQTNLLALNASIEAARAGEAGRGFSVVADEIRNLAEESSDTVEHIQEVTDKVKEAVAKLAADSARLLDFVGSDVSTSFDAFEEMADQYNEDAKFVDEIVTDLSATSEELLASIDGVTGAISDVTKTTIEGAEHTTNIAAKIQKVADETAAINEMMEQTNGSAKKLELDVSVFKVHE